MDYLPAIQFAAALNIGYIIPDLLRKVYTVLNNINAGYSNILQGVKNKAIIKTDEVSHICIVETKDDKSTKKVVDSILAKIKVMLDGCDEKENNLQTIIGKFIDSSGYRSLFFYSALYSIFALLIVPFCHQHHETWNYSLFLYSFSILSLVYLLVLFLFVVITKKDVSCRSVFGLFALFLFLSVLWVYINKYLLPSVVVNGSRESILASLSVIIPFIPGFGCLLFVILLIVYSFLSAKAYSIWTRWQFVKINKLTKKLDEINDFLDGNISIS